jgi:AMIN domain
MKSLPRVRSRWFSLALVIGLPIASSTAQSTSKLLGTTDAPVVVRSVRVVPGPAVEIISSRPLVPVISKLENPPRLVIDLPNADFPADLPNVDLSSVNLSSLDSPANSSATGLLTQEIRRVRVSKYQNAPPVTRVVLDLVTPVGDTWDAAGNRLMVRLHPPDDATSRPPTVAAFSRGVQPIAVPVSAGSTGRVVLASGRLDAGSSVTAGFETSVLRLERGGEVLVCPGTTVSVTSSQSGHALMLGMSTGALEAHYNLDASADSILTPDFRILLAGPGEFHYAVSADSRGNTCIRALPGNTASVIVSELLGEGNYQVKPAEQILFHSGRLNLVDVAVPATCGCPAPPIPVLRASEATPASDAPLPSSMQLASLADKPANSNELPPETAALPPSKPNDVHVQVEVPFVFRAEEAQGANLPVAKPSVIAAAELPPRSWPRPATFQIGALPPAQSRIRPTRHGVFAKIKGFFSTIFS